MLGKTQLNVKGSFPALTASMEIFPVCNAVAIKAPETPRFLNSNQIINVSNTAAYINVNADLIDYFLEKINVYPFAAANPQQIQNNNLRNTHSV